jgi:hypothetical protein
MNATMRIRENIHFGILLYIFVCFDIIRFIRIWFNLSINNIIYEI